MSFWQAVQTCFQKYIDFSGRAGRAEYWWFTLFLVVASIVLGIFDAMTFGIELDSPQVFSNIFAIATLIPSLAVTWRRFHDINKSGWWCLLMFAIMVIGGAFIGAGIVISAGLVGLGILALLGGLIWNIIWAATPGDMGENQYGPDPRATA